MFTLGIDLGKSGGFALLDSSGALALHLAMPKHPVDEGIDHYEVEGFFAKCKHLIGDDKYQVVMEKVWGQAGSGASQMYNFGKNNGYVEGLVHVWFGREIRTVVPRTWQKWLFETTAIAEIQNAKGKRDTKAMAINAVYRLYPEADLRKSARAKKWHDGTVDAVGIAVWGMRNG